jgi:hypothetical protein
MEAAFKACRWHIAGRVPCFWTMGGIPQVHPLLPGHACAIGSLRFARNVTRHAVLQWW